jgi:hypothetical protein
MMTNQSQNAKSKPAGSLPTTWELRTYDVWGNARDGYEVNDVRSAGTVELRIPQTRNNVGVEWHVCQNPECAGNNPCGHNPPCTFGAHRRESHGIVPLMRVPANSQNGASLMPHCPDCNTAEWVMLESQEFISAYPTNRQIKLAFGVTCQIETDGDDINITINRRRDGYPIGEMHCASHESLSPVRKLGAEVKA